MSDMTEPTELFAQPGMRILDAWGDAVLGFDAGGICVHVGAAALGLLQADDPGALLGHPLGELLPRPRPGTLPLWDHCLAHLAANPGKVLRSDLETVTRPDGVEVPVAIGVFSIPVEGGGAVLAVVLRDLGERHRQSKAFHASVKSFRALLDGVSDAILFVSRQGRVVDANLGVQSMFGFPPSALQGKSIDNLLDPELHPRGLLAGAATEAVDGESRHIEFNARNRGGNRFPAEIYLYPSSYFNQPVAMAIVHDISERRRQEAALVATRDLAEQSSRLKGEIIRNMSHEFRTPLAAIIGMGDLLADTALDEEQRTYLDEVQSGARALLDMINRILELAKLESGEYRESRVDFSIRDLLEEQARRFAQTARDKGVTLRVELAPGLPETVGGDMEGIGKVLVLLLENAIKFTQAGTVTLTVGVEPGSAYRFHFAVRDTGIGIPEAARGRLFEAFVQGDGSATRRHGGIGLGLGIASRLVAALGGNLEVESVPGQGSEFSFSLGLHRPEF